MSVNAIGLNQETSQELAHQLNDLLANYSVLYQNVRGFHWNIQGANFFELHVKFEELYNDLFLKIDEVAERILTLGFEPEFNSSKYLAVSEIKEATEAKNGVLALNSILEAFKVILKKQRVILNLSSESDDEGTSAQMGDYIREQEKLVWMYSAYLK